jgi:hypothetical protein
MTINSFILHNILDDLDEYGLKKNEIENFLDYSKPYEERANYSLHIIKGILDEHGKSQIAGSLYDLSNIEPILGNIDIESRDHVLHTLQTYILGIYLNKAFFLPQNIKVESFTWKIACLFHDIGYPVKIAQEILKAYSEKRNQIGEDWESRPKKVGFRVCPTEFNNLYNNKKALSLIQDCLKEWDLDISVESEYQQMVTKESIRHGAISALTALNCIDLYYQKINPKRELKKTLEPYTNIDFNQTHFVKRIIPACSAIYIHDLQPEWFGLNKRIDLKKAPIAFLLKLSDSLQEWQRPSKNNPSGLDPALFKLTIDVRGLTMSANIDSDKKIKMRKEISECLNVQNVRII